MERVVAQPVRTSDGAFPRANVAVARYGRGTVEAELIEVVCESEVSLSVNGEPLAVLLCSNAALRELALGFCYNEGVVDSLAEVRSCTVDKQAAAVEVEVAGRVARPACPTRSSGLGGRALLPPSTTAMRERPLATPGQPRCSIEDVVRAMGVMRSFSREYTITRGMHCSTLFAAGAPLASYEDIGRHNTFDKLAGWCLLNGASAEGTLLTTTGRVSGEMCAKALRLGISGIASLSGPTDAAIAMARDAGIMLVGYARDDSALVYA